MNLWATTMMKDEEDVADRVLYHLVRQGVNGIIVADNLSTDGTADKLDDARQRIGAHPEYSHVEVVIVEDTEVAYRQSEKMTRLGRDAADRGATWILPFDADELWFGVGGTVKEVLTRADAQGKRSALAEYWMYRVTDLDEPTGNPFTSMSYRAPTFSGFHKVAYRFEPHIHLSNGSHFITPEDTEPLLGGLLMRHYPMRSEMQFVHKIVNGYHACRALPPQADLYHGAGWSPFFPIYETEGVDGLRRAFATTAVDGLTFDPAAYEDL